MRFQSEVAADRAIASLTTPPSAQAASNPLRNTNITLEVRHINHIYILISPNEIIYSNMTLTSLLEYNWSDISQRILQFSALQTIFFGFSTLEDITEFVEKAPLPEELLQHHACSFGHEIRRSKGDESSWDRLWQKVDITSMKPAGELRRSCSHSV